MQIMEGKKVLVLWAKQNLGRGTRDRFWGVEQEVLQF